MAHYLFTPNHYFNYACTQIQNMFLEKNAVPLLEAQGKDMGSWSFSLYGGKWHHLVNNTPQILYYRNSTFSSKLVGHYILWVEKYSTRLIPRISPSENTI